MIMEQLATSRQAAAGFIGSVASHLGHPGFGRVACDTGESDAPALQVEKEQHVLRDEATPSENFDGEEIRAGENCHMRSDKILPGRVLAAFRRRGDAMPLEDVSDRLIRNVVTEVGQCAGNPIVAPTGILLGHTDDERLDRGIYTRTSWIGTMLRAVELTGNQTTIPGQNGIWLGNTGYLRQMFPAQALGDPSEGKPFRVGKP